MDKHSPLTHIIVHNAHEHNLKNINLNLPKNKLVVITGVSGSGKSTLAFDTIYAEGQRKYIESLSAYARQFLDMMDKPKVDKIEGLSPAISIDQKTTSKNPRGSRGFWDMVTSIATRESRFYQFLSVKLASSRVSRQIQHHVAKMLAAKTLRPQ